MSGNRPLPTKLGATHDRPQGSNCGGRCGHRRACGKANNFWRHNIRITGAMIPHFRDEERLVSASNSGRDELAEQIARDRQQFEEELSSKGWQVSIAALIHAVP